VCWYTRLWAGPGKVAYPCGTDGEIRGHRLGPDIKLKTLSSLTGLGKREAVRANDHHRILRMGIGD
jgi:hypothetical protein